MTQRRSTQVRETPRKRMVQARIKARALENNTTIRNGNIIIIYRHLIDWIPRRERYVVQMFANGKSCFDLVGPYIVSEHSERYAIEQGRL
jgi:hypothetical protein